MPFALRLRVAVIVAYLLGCWCTCRLCIVKSMLPSCTAEDVQRSLGDAVDLIVDAGSTPGGRPSTVIDVQGSIRIVREGAIAREIIERHLASHGMYLDGESR